MQATGLLTFAIDTQLHPGLTHFWIDEPEQLLDQQVSEIAAVTVATGPICPDPSGCMSAKAAIPAAVCRSTRSTRASASQ